MAIESRFNAPGHRITCFVSRSRVDLIIERSEDLLSPRTSRGGTVEGVRRRERGIAGAALVVNPLIFMTPPGTVFATFVDRRIILPCREGKPKSLLSDAVYTHRLYHPQIT